MSSKSSGKEKRLFSRFLKERQLSEIYKRYISLHGRKRKAVSLEVGGETRAAVAYQNKGRIKFRDPKALYVIASTTRIKKLSKMPVSFKVRELPRSSFLGIKLSKGKFLPQFRRTDVQREIFAQTIQYRTARPLASKQGKIFLRVKFWKGRSFQVAEGGSRHLWNLSHARQRKAAFDEAFQGALGQCTIGSYDFYEIISIRFSYTLPKITQRLVFV